MSEIASLLFVDYLSFGPINYLLAGMVVCLVIGGVRLSRGKGSDWVNAAINSYIADQE